MSKILYGVAGEGSGHSSRAREIIRHLLRSGHEVKIVSYDKGYKNLSTDFDVEDIFGLHFYYENNKVKIVPTVFKNLLKTDQAIKSINKVVKIIDEFKPDIVFSDFEPISCVAANMKKLPLISIDNQHRLNNTDIEYPKKYTNDARTAIAVVNLMIFNSKANLVTTFFKAPVKNKKTFLFPPILREEVLRAEVKEKDCILVYLTSPFEGLIDILKNINKKFIVYGFNKNEKRNNLVFKQASQKGFLQDLANCEGVIANAGFTLMTEALHLRKPYLALPVAGQFEQVLNAYYLEKLGYGKYWDELNQERIEAFLYNIDLYKEGVKKYVKQDNTKILKKVDQLISKYK